MPLRSDVSDLAVRDGRIAEKDFINHAMGIDVYAQVVRHMTEFQPPRRVSFNGAQDKLVVVGFSNNGNGEVVMVQSTRTNTPVPIPRGCLKNKDLWRQWTEP
tara:strand:+ start:65 stop:370 length:306 start_codon:yes stop_codon:yes gene_type:complete